MKTTKIPLTRTRRLRRLGAHILTIFCAFLASLPAWGQTMEWKSGFNVRGSTVGDGRYGESEDEEGVHAIAVSATAVYYAGLFDTFGPIQATNIARVDKATGAVTPLGSGLSTAYGVKALAIIGSDLYAGGEFYTAGGAVADGIAKWNGTTWAAVGSGLGAGGSVSALAVMGTDLYVAGSFNTAGGVTVNGLAKWNGTTWSAVGGGTDGFISALHVAGSDLYVGGEFTAAGGVPAANIAKWNGTVWSALGAGMPGRVVSSITSIGTTVFAGLSQTDANYLYQWNGTAWSDAGFDFNNAFAVKALLAADGALVVGGAFDGTLFRYTYDDGDWYQDYDFGNDSDRKVGFDFGVEGAAVNALAQDGTAILAGGKFTQVFTDYPDIGEYGYTSAVNAAKIVPDFDSNDGWKRSAVVAGNGLAHSGMGSIGANAILDEGAVVWVAGAFNFVGEELILENPESQTGIAKWHKATKTWLPAGLNFLTYQDASITSLARANGKLYAGLDDGKLFRLNDTDPDYLEWDYVGTANGPINSMTALGTDLVVAGDFTSVGGASAASIAKWNGTAWSALGSGITGGGSNRGVHALKAVGSDLYAGGNFSTAGGVAAVGIAKWNGTAWSAVGSAFTTNDYVYSLEILGSDLVAGGYFPGNIQKWNGTAWSAVGGGLNGPVFGLNTNGSNLYAAGEFIVGSGRGAAVWNGSTWSALGTGIYVDVNGEIGGHAIVADGTSVFIGGTFTAAGGLPSHGFAEYGPVAATFGPDVKISDAFDDGNIATNTTGVGHGFVKRGQGDSTESGGFLNNSPGNTATRVYMSNTADAVNPFSATGAATILKYTYGDLPHVVSGSERIWLGYRVSGAISDHFHPSLTASAGFAQKVQGLYISLLEQNSSTYTRHGNLVAVSNTGVEKKLASWDWQNPAALSGVVVTLTTNSTNYSLSFSGAAGAVPTNITGALAGPLSGLGPITTDFDTGFHSQWLATTIDSVLLRVIPPPSVTAPNVSVLGGTEVILGGNATGINGPVSARGFVYALASQNGNPTVGGANVTQQSAGSGTGLFTSVISGLTPNETYVFRSYVTDATGTVYTDTIVFTTPADTTPITMVVATTGTNVPGAGVVGSGIPSGAKWTTLGTPAINDSTQVAFVGGYKAASGSGKGVFVDETQVLAVGAAAPGLPGVTITNVFDPLIDAAGNITFRATLKGTGVSASNDGAFITNAGSGILRVLAREGDQAVGAPDGAVWKSLSNIATPGAPLRFLFTGQLLSGPNNTAGPGGVTTANDIGLWASDSSGDLRLLFREGDTIGTKTLKSFQVLTITVGTQGSARSFNQIGTITWRATYTDNTVELLTTQVQ